MKTIGILGANGQVGTEVSLYLSQWPDVRVVAICRSAYASAFLRRCGIECRHGDVGQPEQARELVRECDLVADFTLPHGLPSEVQDAICRIITGVMSSAPARSGFVYISSTMAFGMGTRTRAIKHYRLPRTPYGAAKRYGEALAFRAGSASGRDVWALRLGHVHGENQAVSKLILDKIQPGPVMVSDQPSDTVFAFSVAEALANIAAGQETPGRYTLVSNPEWTFRELYLHYAHRKGIQSQVAPAAPAAPRGGGVLRAASAATRAWFALGMSIVDHNREPFDALMASVLVAMPTLERRITARYSQLRAHREVAVLTSAETVGPVGAFEGTVPGDRLRSLSDSRTTMEPRAALVRALYERAGVVAPSVPA